MNAWEMRRRDVLKALGVGMGCLPLLQSSRGSAAAIGAQAAAHRRQPRKATASRSGDPWTGP